MWTYPNHNFQDKNEKEAKQLASINIKKNIYDRLKRKAKAEGFSMCGFLTKIIEEWSEKNLK